MMENLRVDKDMVVALRYIMRNGNGDVLEDTMQSAPVNYLHGSTGILPLLQQQLLGLKPGDKKRVYLFRESSEADDDFDFDVIIDDVREALAEEIVLGYPVQITAKICEEDCVCYDEQSLK
jgi:FKBP-type peptidyl-prolyl cis-trans isomerase 2